jgi:hypothetical protein
MKNFMTVILAIGLQTGSVWASGNSMDEMDPFDPAIEQKLMQMDQDYEAATGQSAVLDFMKPFGPACYQIECTIWLDINKSTQRMRFFMNGVLQATWPVSTGVAGHGTPDFDTNPNGRIYDAYTSTKYPGGDYMGLGNMPYAVFIDGGFAVHGTGQSNWPKLGTRASHGCIRVHPDNAKVINRLVRQYGIYQTWITVHD